MFIADELIAFATSTRALAANKVRPASLCLLQGIELIAPLFGVKIQ